jgi:acyl-CoA synthetase (AMP-forming)/AMP-acid ligase II
MATAVLQPIAGYSDAFKCTSVEVLEREASPELDLETHEPRTIDELIKLRARESGCDEPIISYPHEGTNYIDYSPKDLDRLVEQAAHLYSYVVPQRTTSDDPVQVVGLLGDSDLSYLIALLAISRLGHTALLLSTRITDEAYESLLSTTKATALIYQSTFKAAAQKVFGVLPQLRTAAIVEHTILADRNAALKVATLDPHRETKNGSFIIHSSGSTGLPKPIYQTHSASLYTYSQHFSLVGHLTLPLHQ